MTLRTLQPILASVRVGRVRARRFSRLQPYSTAWRPQLTTATEVQGPAAPALLGDYGDGAIPLGGSRLAGFIGHGGGSQRNESGARCATADTRVIPVATQANADRLAGC
jgi:hypothetical protein